MANAADVLSVWYGRSVVACSFARGKAFRGTGGRGVAQAARAAARVGVVT